MTDLVLYGHPDSGHACKVALALSMVGLAHRTVWVDIWADPATRPAGFRAASPLSEVPLLTIDGVPHISPGRSCWRSPPASAASAARRRPASAGGASF